MYDNGRAIKIRFKTANVRVTSINEQWDIYLISMSNLADENGIHRGSEFVNRCFKKLMKEERIYFFTTKNPTKANFVGRVQRTIKTSLYRMMRLKRS